MKIPQRASDGRINTNVRQNNLKRVRRNN